MRRLAVLLLLAGCATTHNAWFKDGATQQDFYMDQGQCKAQAFSAPGMPMMQVGLVFNSCMQGKGWYLREVPN
jgi:hypothetical protein